MLLSLFTIGLAFTWLLIETHFLTVHLPCGRISRHDFINIYDGQIQQTEFIPKAFNNPYANLLPVQCSLTYQQEVMGKNAREDMKTATYRQIERVLNKTSYQQMTFGDSTIIVSATLPKLYEYIDDARKAQGIKRAGGFAEAPCKQIPMFIEQVRVGSHNEWIATDDNGHGFHRIVEDKHTVYRDCLVPKEWLKEHEHDLDGYEPTIDITINDKTFNVNGNYKKGVIQGFMLQYAKRIKVGRKTETVFEGAEVMDMGGGLKIVTYPETNEDLARAETATV